MDELGGVLAHLAETLDPNIVEVDATQRPLLIRDVTTFADLTDAAFIGIRQYGSTHVSVMIRVLETIEMVLPLCRRETSRGADAPRRDGCRGSFGPGRGAGGSCRYRGTVGRGQRA